MSTIFHIPPDINALGIALFIQQMGLWGQDTKRAEGNLFLEYGFIRERPPVGETGDTAYFLSLDEQKSLMLWRFGLFYLDTQIGGILLKRRSLIPRLAPPSTMPTKRWQVTDIPEAALPTTLEEGQKACALLSTAFLWISSYEKWVTSTLGTAYRLRCLETQNEAYIPPQGLDAEWERLAEHCLHFVVDQNKAKDEFATHC